MYLIIMRLIFNFNRKVFQNRKPTHNPIVSKRKEDTPHSASSFYMNINDYCQFRSSPSISSTEERSVLLVSIKSLIVLQAYRTVE